MEAFALAAAVFVPQGQPKVAQRFISSLGQRAPNPQSPVRAPSGAKGHGKYRTSSFVPDGTLYVFGFLPTDKSVGYFRASLRD
jgi:hypothetical protein